MNNSTPPHTHVLHTNMTLISKHAVQPRLSYIGGQMSQDTGTREASASVL